MKLHEFQIADHRPGLPGHGDAVSAGLRWVGGVGIEVSAAARGQHHGSGLQPAQGSGMQHLQAAAAAGRDPKSVKICVAAPAYVTDGSAGHLAHGRDQCRWFGGMVGNHVADIVERYGDNSEVPKALTDYIKGRQGYDYNEHGRAGNSHTTFVPDEIVDRFCIVGPVQTQIDRLLELRALGVDQFSVYLQHDAKDETLLAYGEKVIPTIAEHVLAKS